MTREPERPGASARPSPETTAATADGRESTADVEVLTPLTEEQARRLDRRIRLMADAVVTNVGKLRRLVAEAQAGHVHLTLGYQSWPAYVADAVGGSVQVAGDARRDVVELLAGAGMSVRGIAQATGVGKSTVARDLSQVSRSGTPGGPALPEPTVPSKKIARRREWPAGEMAKMQAEQADTAPSSLAPVTGLDGKTYTKPQPRPKPAAPRRRTPLPDAFRSATYELKKAADRICRLADDDRFDANRDTLADGHLGDLHRVYAAIGKVIDQLAGQLDADDSGGSEVSG